MFTYIDLDEIENDELESIPTPVERNLPSQFEDLTGTESGTLVVWKNMTDKKEMLKKSLKNLEFGLGEHTDISYGELITKVTVDSVHRTGPVKIWIDNEEVKVIDPLYARLGRTPFPDDPQAEVYADMSVNWKADKNAENPGADSEIIIRMSFSSR